MSAAGPPDLDRKYRELQPALLRHLRYAHADQAEDIAADVWTEVAAGLPRFSGDDGDFRAWLFTLARRRLIDSYRRSGRRPVDHLGDDEALRLVIPGIEDDAVERLSSLATITTVHDLLPRHQAEIVLLRVVGGYGVQRVARLTGLRPVNVRVIQHRALRRLAQRLSPVSAAGTLVLRPTPEAADEDAGPVGLRSA